MSYAHPSPPISQTLFLDQVVRKRFEPSRLDGLNAGELLLQRRDPLALGARCRPRPIDPRRGAR